MLEINNFDTAAFQTVTSSFKHENESKHPFAPVTNWNSSFKNENSTKLGM